MKRPLPVPVQGTDLVDKDGKPTSHNYRWMESLGSSVIDTQNSVTTLETSVTSLNTTVTNNFANVTGTAPLYYCRAWVNFDGTKDTTGAASTSNTNRLLKGNGNVATVLRNAIGNYTITFSVAMPDANYGVSLSAPQYTTTNGTVFPYIYGSVSVGTPTTKTSTSLCVCWMNTAGTGYDPTDYTVLIFR